MGEQFNLYEDDHPPFGSHYHLEHDKYNQRELFERIRKTFFEVLPERFRVRDNFSLWGSFNIEEIETCRSYLSVHLNRGSHFPFSYRMHIYVLREEGLELLKKCVKEVI